jgi:hypothetical protein
MDPYSPHWGTDDWIVFSSPAGNFRIPAAGGTPERLPQVRGRTPFLLADGSGILFSGAGDIALFDSDRVVRARAAARQWSHSPS